MDRRERLEKEIQRLQENLDACFEKRLGTDDPVKEVTLEALENQLEEKIEKKQRELNESIDAPASQNLKALNLEKGLCSVDFEMARERVHTLMNALDDSEEGSALLLLERCFEMEGNLFLKSLRDSLAARAGQLREFPMEFPPTMPADELAFLSLLGGYLQLNFEESNLDRAQHLSETADCVVKEIAKGLQPGTTVLISLRNWRKIAIDAQPVFLDWFMKTFWCRLVAAVTEVRKEYSPKVFFVIVVDEAMSEPCQSSGYFCEDEELDARKIVRLPLGYWTQEDIRRWLAGYSMKLRNTERDELVSYIFHEKVEDAPLNIRRLLEIEHAKATF